MEFFNNLGDSGTDLIHRFYVWATVNAKGPFAESQYYTAESLEAVLEAGLVGSGHRDTVRNIIVRCYVAVIDEFPEGYLFDDGDPSQGIPADGTIERVTLAAGRAYGNLATYSDIFDRSVFRAEFGNTSSGDEPPGPEMSDNVITKVIRVKGNYGWR